jgi:ribose transport system ATP-binding protein
LVLERSVGMPPGEEYILEMREISKEFIGVRALDRVNFNLRGGEVHALVGENGAGKSTLIKILMGTYAPTEGKIIYRSKEIDVKSPLHAKKLGFGAVYQDVNLAQHLSVAENFFLGELPVTRFGTVDYRRAWDETRKSLESIDVHIDPKQRMRDLSVAQQEMVIIGKMLRQRANIIVFDEPTALLTNDETRELFKIIELLKSQNVGVIYISHRLDEIFKICDRATVLKDGRCVGTEYVRDLTEDKLISMMVSREVEDIYKIKRGTPGDVVLEVEGLTRGGAFGDVSFSVRRGEVFGMFGLIGSGRTEIVRSLFGADRYDSGTVKINGRPVLMKTPVRAIGRGVALLPENRKEQGLCLKMTVSDNINMAATSEISVAGIMNHSRAKTVAEKFVGMLNIKTPSIRQRCANLSGGNQQKVVISKWLARECDIFILDEPTVGVDVGARAEIYHIFERLLGEGKAIIVISSYLPEVMGLADSILVMHEGRQMGIIERKRFDEERILGMASGIMEAER